LIDLSDLSLPTPKTQPKYNWLCVGCRRVSASRGSCAVCGCKEFVVHLDRRPLLLSKETRNGIVDLIDKAASLVPQADIDEQIRLTGEYMPFLSQLLTDAELAEKRNRAEGCGFRTTTLTTPELLALFQDMKFPTS